MVCLIISIKFIYCSPQYEAIWSATVIAYSITCLEGNISPINNLHAEVKSFTCMHMIYVYSSVWLENELLLSSSISPQYGCSNLSLFKSLFAFTATAACAILC